MEWKNFHFDKLLKSMDSSRKKERIMVEIWDRDHKYMLDIIKN